MFFLRVVQVEGLCNRPAEAVAELRAAAALRAQAFYAYPPERAFAGQVCAVNPTSGLPKGSTRTARAALLGTRPLWNLERWCCVSLQLCKRQHLLLALPFARAVVLGTRGSV